MKALFQSLEDRRRRLHDGQRLSDLAVSENGFVFVPHSGRSFVANESAIAILDALRNGSTARAVIQRLTDRFDVTPEEAVIALDPFLDTLEEALS